MVLVGSGPGAGGGGGGMAPVLHACLIGMPLQLFFLVTQLPAAAKGSIDVDQVECDVARGDRQLVLLLDLRGFQIENSVEIDRAGAVLLHSELRWPPWPP